MRFRGHIRGVALITAIFFAVLCIGLATGFMLRVPVDLGATGELRSSTEAAYVADAAVQDTMAWLSHQLANETEPCTISDPTPSRSGSLDNWDWTCTVEPDAGTPPNGLTDLRLYKLTATALSDGESRYRIVVDVQAGQSFSRFSVYIDETSTLSPFYDFIVTPSARMRGPIHKNEPISFKVAPSLLVGSPPDPLPFDSTISTPAGHHWWTRTTFRDLGTELTSEQYDNIFESGGADLLYGVPPRPLPTDSMGLANAAWGGMTPPSPPPGVQVSPAGGVFISGDVDAMEMSLNGGGQFVLTIVQGGQTTTITEDAAANQRIVTDSTGTNNISGLGSGVVFATGDIRSLKGVNKGPHTIANAFDDNKFIEISGSLTRADTPVGNEPSGTDDRLGIVSSTIFVAEHSVLPRNQSTPLYVYANLLATTIFEVKDRNIDPPGAMAIFGGLATRQPWRTVSVTGPLYQVTHGYGARSGYGSADILYDKHLANEPPPMYPTTAGTELMVRAWREQPL